MKYNTFSGDIRIKNRSKHYLFVLCLDAKNQRSSLQIINFKTTQLKIPAAIQAVSEYIVHLFRNICRRNSWIAHMPSRYF